MLSSVSAVLVAVQLHILNFPVAEVAQGFPRLRVPRSAQNHPFLVPPFLWRLQITLQQVFWVFFSSAVPAAKTFKSLSCRRRTLHLSARRLLRPSMAWWLRRGLLRQP